MQQRNVSSRAVCAYCGMHTRPNAMYCMQCGQIVTVVARASNGQSGSAAFAPPTTGAQPTSHTPRTPVQQHLLPMPGIPAVPQLPPAAAHARPADTHTAIGAGIGASTGTGPGENSTVNSGANGVPRSPQGAGPAAAPAATPAAVPPPLPRLSTQAVQIIELGLPDGSRARVHGAAVLGRMPEATARNSGAQAITIPDSTRSVSRAHALIELHGRAVAVSDSGSANGSWVERDGARLALEGDREVSLRNGDRIWLGEVPVDVHITRPQAQAA